MPVVYQLGPLVLLVITGHEFSLLMVNETTDQDAFRYLSEFPVSIVDLNTDVQ